MIPCPFCHHPLDVHKAPGQPGGAAPKNGDLTLCIECGEWSAFAAGQLVKPSPEDYESVATNRHAIRLRAAWLASRIDDRMTIAKAWHTYRDECLGRVPPRGVALCEASFYAGAVAYWLAQQEGKKAATREMATAIADLLQAEITAYANKQAKWRE